jgi:hypothetical protein
MPVRAGIRQQVCHCDPLPTVDLPNLGTFLEMRDHTVAKRLVEHLKRSGVEKVVANRLQKVDPNQCSSYMQPATGDANSE